jgi:hypothetical protein
MEFTAELLQTPGACPSRAKWMTAVDMARNGCALIRRIPGTDIIAVQSEPYIHNRIGGFNYPRQRAGDAWLGCRCGGTDRAWRRQATRNG